MIGIWSLREKHLLNGTQGEDGPSDECDRDPNRGATVGVLPDVMVYRGGIEQCWQRVKPLGKRLKRTI